MVFNKAFWEAIAFLVIVLAQRNMNKDKVWLVTLWYAEWVLYLEIDIHTTGMQVF